MTTIAMPALAGKHVLKPLPFAPTALKGLSEKLIVSHYENNYGGAVRNLNNLEKQPFVAARAATLLPRA